MMLDPAQILPPAQNADQEALPPGGVRSQSMQRLQIGLFGLAAMVLLVGLANLIITNADRNQARVVPEAASTVAAERAATPASDPLAEAGVVPDMPDKAPPSPKAPGDTVRDGAGPEIP